MKMSDEKMNTEEAKQLSHRFQEFAQPHTDVFFSLRRSDERTAVFEKVGSAIHITYKGLSLAVTCHHVAPIGCIYFTNPKRLKRPTIPDGEKAFRQNVEELARSEALDLAVFDTSNIDVGAHGKQRYDLQKSGGVTPETVGKNIGTLSCIYGVWGKHVSGKSWEDAVLYIQFPVYTGLGPITGIERGFVIGDFAENEILERPKPNTEFEVLKTIMPTGGARDLSGCSGSGLWVLCGGEPVLAGILLGPEPSQHDQHLIRFTPVWSLMTLIDQKIIQQEAGPYGSPATGSPSS